MEKDLPAGNVLNNLTVTLNCSRRVAKELLFLRSYAFTMNPKLFNPDMNINIIYNS